MFFGRKSLVDDEPINNTETLFSKIAKAKQEDMVDVIGLAHAIGLITASVTMPKEVAGEMEPNGSTWRLRYNAAHRHTRQRFTIAHQIGHYIYHRDLLSRPALKGAADNLSYRQPENHRLANPYLLPSHETQANRFAVSLIMPEENIRRMLAEGDNVFQIAERTGTAVQAMAIRLKTLK